MSVKGQDWASYQGLHPAAAGLDFVFIKTTEGLTYVNPDWTSQVVSAKASGAVLGFYHYPHMKNSATAEAAYFKSVAKPVPGQLLALDWEGYDSNNAGVGQKAMTAYKTEFVNALKALCPNNPVGVYCNITYFNFSDGFFGDFLWIADPNHPAGKPAIPGNWKFHQYSVDQGVDNNVGNFTDKSDLVSWAATFIGDGMNLTSQDYALIAQYVWAYKNSKLDTTDMRQHLVDVWNATTALEAAVSGLATDEAAVKSLLESLSTQQPEQIAETLMSLLKAQMAK